jgi:hypothetical protein
VDADVVAMRRRRRLVPDEGGGDVVVLDEGDGVSFRVTRAAAFPSFISLNRD